MTSLSPQSRLTWCLWRRITYHREGKQVGLRLKCTQQAQLTTPDSRFVLANTEVLHEKISVLATRVRELEDALAEAHAARSSDQHPLLTPELLQLKRPLEREAPEPAREPEVEAA